jgi:hypothetical protein
MNDWASLFEKIFNPSTGERFIFLCQKPSGETDEPARSRLDLAGVWRSSLEGPAQVRGFNLEPVALFSCEKSPDGGLTGEVEIEGDAAPLDGFLDGLSDKDILVVVSGTSITAELLKRVEGQRFRAAAAPGIDSGSPGLKADYSRIPFRAEALNLRLDIAEFAAVTFTSEGVEGFPAEAVHFTFDLRGQSFHVLDNGECRSPGRLINLPSGCANIIPYRGDDPELGPSLTHGDLPVEQDGELVLLKIEGGRIADASGPGGALEAWKARIADPDAAAVTKLGLGLNEDCRVVGTRVVDEKTLGLHAGVGPSRDLPSVYTSTSPVKATVWLRYKGGREELIMNQGVYNHEVLGEVFRL